MLQTQKNQNKYRLCFGLCALGAACMFLPFVIVDKGLFLYAGDFNSQQIPFYYYANEFIKSGGGSFSWATDLGSGFLNSYSFYHLGSPFFWFSLLFPASWQPFLMAPMLVLKFAVAGAGAYLWAKRYTKDPNMAVLAGCMYAFSGFTVYNVFFNHFVDVIALFPYLLWALDEAVHENRRGTFAFFVALNFLNNYFFFAGQVIFLPIYVIWMVVCGNYKINRKTFGRLAFESIIGCGMGAILAWPALLSLLNNPRTVDLSSGFGFLLYGKTQQYAAIIYSMFFPPDSPYMPVIFTEGTIKWTSMSTYLPLMSMVGVIAYMRSKSGTSFKRILYTCLVMAFVPALNSAFYMMNSSYYARWYYMPVLIMCVVSVQALEDETVKIEKGLWPTVAVLCSFIAFALVPTKTDEGWSLGVIEHPEKFWLNLFVALFGIAVFYLLWQMSARKPKLARQLTAGVLAFGCFYGALHIAIGKFAQWDNDANYRQEQYVGTRNLTETLPDGAYRIDAYECYDNVGLWANKSALHCFNSTVSPSILEFYPSVGVKRDVRTEVGTEDYALQTLLGVRFTVMPEDKVGEFLDKTKNSWVLFAEEDGLAVYENENPLPLAFGVDFYLTQDEFNEVNEKKRGSVLLRGLVLSEEQAEEMGDCVLHLTEFAQTNNTEEQYQIDLAARQAMAATQVELDNYGTTAQVNFAQRTPVLFTVPWDEGFTATVNGEPATLYKVDNGLMAVVAPQGESEIRLTYKTKGLDQSLTVAAISAVLFVAYLLVGNQADKRKKNPQLAVEADAVPAETEQTTLPQSGSIVIPLDLEPDANPEPSNPTQPTQQPQND